MKNAQKIISIFLILIMIVSISSVVFAASTKPLKPDDLKGGEADVEEIQNLGKKIVAVIQTVGVVASVIIMLVLGIKYMMGSAEDKAEYKKSMIPYIVGAVLIFAATTIVNIVYNFAMGLSTK